MARDRRPAVWLLSEWPDHGSGGVARVNPETERSTDRHGDERAHLSLRNVSAYSRRNQSCRGETLMSARDFLPWLSAPAPDSDRRVFIKMLGMSGLVFVAGPPGIRRLEELSLAS